MFGTRPNPVGTESGFPYRIPTLIESVVKHRIGLVHGENGVAYLEGKASFRLRWHGKSNDNLVHTHKNRAKN